MKTLLIEREPSTDQGTFGTATLYDDDGATGAYHQGLDISERMSALAHYQSLELPDRGNAHGVSCINPGTYHARLIDSPHFQRKVYLLEGVPGRSSIELHPANWGGDRTLGWHSDLRGCMAVGRGRGELTPPDTGIAQHAILSSTAALDELIGLAGDELTIVVRAPA